MIKINGTPVQVNHFPDGTLRLNVEATTHHVIIEWLYEKDEEMVLYFIVKHLREQYEVESIKLSMPYIPNARMDRIKNSSEVFTLKYFCQFINDMKFDTVIVRDAHSSVSLALLNNVVSNDIRNNIIALKRNLLHPDKDIIFYPDEGSCKRYSEMIKFPCAFGIKKRNWNDGKIIGLDVQGELPSTTFNVLIVDDISSYGGTFLHSARKLKEFGADKIYLYVTHCENSILDGELINSGLIEKIYTTKSIFTKQHDLIEVIGDNDNE